MGPYRFRFVLAVIAATVALTSGITGPVSAAPSSLPTGHAAMAQATTTVPPPPATTKTAPADDDAENGGRSWPWLALAALALGLVSPGLVLVFVRKESEATQTTVREALRLGRSTTIIRIEATDMADLSAEVTGASMTIAGPDTIEVKRAYEYTANVGDTETKATWTVVPTGFVSLPKRPAAKVSVKPTTDGSFTLLAQAADGTKGDKKVTVVTPPESSKEPFSIPFIGQGWGSIVVALFVAALVTALGMVRVLNGQALATFFGALVGYVFNKASDERDRRQTGSEGGGDSAATGGGGATQTGGGGAQPDAEGGAVADPSPKPNMGAPSADPVPAAPAQRPQVRVRPPRA